MAARLSSLHEPSRYVPWIRIVYSNKLWPRHHDSTDATFTATTRAILTRSSIERASPMYNTSSLLFSVPTTLYVHRCIYVCMHLYMYVCMCAYMHKCFQCRSSTCWSHEAAFFLRAGCCALNLLLPVRSEITRVSSRRVSCWFPSICDVRDRPSTRCELDILAVHQFQFVVLFSSRP